MANIAPAIHQHNVPAPILVSESPRIVLNPGFLTPTECDHFKSLGMQHGMKPALLVGKTHGVDIKTNERTNVSCWLPHDTSAITLAVVTRIAALVGIPLEYAEQIQLIYYRENQFYMPHFDGWDMPDDVSQMTEEQRVIKARYMDPQGGQRMVTTLCYLNTVPAGGGGETEFPNLRVQTAQPAAPQTPGTAVPLPPTETLKVYPEAGKLVCFSNVHAGTNKLHPNSLHAGCSVRAVVDPQTGAVQPVEKWAFNLWFRERNPRLGRQ